MIIGLSGYAGSGKDTVCEIIQKTGFFQRKAFADPIRNVVWALNPILNREMNTVREAVNALGWDEAKRTFPELRRLLQVTGTEVGRKMFAEDFWVAIAMRDVSATDDVVFTDVRFYNEAIAIKNKGGQIWRIEREGFKPVNGHVSETAMDNWKFDVTVRNNGTLEELEDTVKYLLTFDEIKETT